MAAASVLHISEVVERKLKAAKFGGKKHDEKDREADMMAYLSKFVDDLLLDTRDTLHSHAPGFEGPLGVHVEGKSGH